MATQMTMQAMGPTRASSMKMVGVGGLPSPTLTNPDMVLPDEPLRYHGFTSPSRNAWRERPPSPSYLRDTPPQSVRDRSSSGGSNMATPKKEKRGLMSRKMMLLRSRTSSSGLGIQGGGVQVENEFGDFDGMYGSSPTLMDVGNLAPEQRQYRRESSGGSSLGSDEMRGLPQFLAKYDTRNSSGTEDEWDGESPASQRYASTESIDGGLDAHRRQQEEDEQHSAILSKRAEQILANAKKRLNLMEGNLRGARDLVQPLTSANLKRATSVGSYAVPGAVYGMRGRYVHDGYQYEPSPQQRQRKLQAQASSPTMGQDLQGYYRGFSELDLPNRPSTSLERTNTPVGATPRLSQQRNEPQRRSGVKESRSYDSLGGHFARRPDSRDPSYTRGSPDPNLGPLAEDDGQERIFAPPHSRFSDRHASIGGHSNSSRSSSRTDNLREQMSSLQGKISTLKQRAREDSARRASMQNLREPSPLNNATITAPEFFYTSSPTYGSPKLDTNAGQGFSSPNYSPVQNQQHQQTWEPQQVLTGSRNAFAQQAQPGSDRSSQRSSQKYRKVDKRPQPKPQHKRTPSGTAIVESSKHRYSHHEYTHSRNVSGETVYVEARNGEVGVARGEPQDDDTVSQSEASVYEDAETEQPPPVVAHEDREDAFDYEQYWRNTVMGNGLGTERRGSVSSEDSESSVETARGPTRTAEEIADLEADTDGDDELYEDSDTIPPSSPETPERLREIERNIHKRTFSDESVSTVASFATAAEGQSSPPPPTSKRSSAVSANWPIPKSEPHSRPATAIPVKRPSPIALARSDSSSERADSGVALTGRSHSSQSTKRSPLSSSTTTGRKTFSPPMSPGAFTDPATVAVNAVLASDGRQLGLRDKALLFSLVESLRGVCLQLQEREENGFESRALRRRLDDARKILNGAMS